LHFIFERIEDLNEEIVRKLSMHFKEKWFVRDNTNEQSVQMYQQLLDLQHTQPTVI